MPTSNSTNRRSTATGTDPTLGGDEIAAADFGTGTPQMPETFGTERTTATADTQTTEAPLAEAGREAIHTAGQLVERATDTGIRQADRGREQAAEGLHALAGKFRMASSELEPQQPAIANVTQFAAEGTDRLANYLRETDVRQIISNVEGAARRQPLLFIGGAFLLGLAGARFLKAASGPSGREFRSGYAYPRATSYGYRTGVGTGDTAAYDIGSESPAGRGVGSTSGGR